MEFPRSVEKAKEMWERTKARAKSIAEKAEKHIDAGISAGETVVAAAASDYANELWGKADNDGDYSHKIGKVDTDVIAGIAGHGAAFFGFAGKYEGHLHSLSTGPLTTFAARQARKAGRARRNNASTAPATTKGRPLGAAPAWTAAGQAQRQWAPQPVRR